MKTFKNLTLKNVHVGMLVMYVFCGRPVGVVGKPVKQHTVTKINRLTVTLSDGKKVKLGEHELLCVSNYCNV